MPDLRRTRSRSLLRGTHRSGARTNAKNPAQQTPPLEFTELQSSRIESRKRTAGPFAPGSDASSQSRVISQQRVHVNVGYRVRGDCNAILPTNNPRSLWFNLTSDRANPVSESNNSTLSWNNSMSEHLNSISGWKNPISGCSKLISSWNSPMSERSKPVSECFRLMSDYFNSMSGRSNSMLNLNNSRRKNARFWLKSIKNDEFGNSNSRFCTFR